MIEVKPSDDPHIYYLDSVGVEVTAQAEEQFAEQAGSYLEFGFVGNRQILHRHRDSGSGDFPAAGGVDYPLFKLGQVGKHGQGLRLVHAPSVDYVLRNVTSDGLTRP